MDFREFGNQSGRTLLLLPGTACTWQLNFKNVVDDLAEKIEEYIIKNHGGRVDGAYGSSLGGSFAGLLIQRKRVHIAHGFIGSSDLDQGSPVVARLLTMLVGPMLSGACRSESRREKLRAKLQRKGAIGDGVRDGLLLAGAGEVLRPGLPDIETGRGLHDLQRIRRHGHCEQEV